ncbi:hypothetical protein [Bdellovibrio sp. KM01]|uniref:hypothetical protein n=1 Tax=Bdellovibrio sp. KM01 TaxID=2748865 RepID=UPI0015EA02CB|nr:hypothetical protein [Bdellovibrio sp. KM01]QLY26713.1 hypothetical protein HW988_06810 [Bdellovibrio sp. KM01]
MRNILVLAALLFVDGAAEACVGFTGSYSMFRPVAGKYHVLVLDQNDCKAVAAGSFQLDEKTSAVTDEVEPKVFYVEKNHTKLCELSACRVFTTTASGLEFAESASIYIDGITCRYDRVSWSRQDTWDLKVTYRITDSSSACRKYRGAASVILKDIKH